MVGWAETLIIILLSPDSEPSYEVQVHKTIVQCSEFFVSICNLKRSNPCFLIMVGTQWTTNEPWAWKSGSNRCLEGLLIFRACEVLYFILWHSKCSQFLSAFGHSKSRFHLSILVIRRPKSGQLVFWSIGARAGDPSTF